jgi:hypothetical protein
VLDQRDRVHQVLVGGGRPAVDGVWYRTNVSGRWRRSRLTAQVQALSGVQLVIDPVTHRLAVAYGGFDGAQQLLVATKSPRAARFAPAVDHPAGPVGSFSGQTSLAAHGGRITVAVHRQPDRSVIVMTGTTAANIGAPLPVAGSGGELEDIAVGAGARSSLLLAWGDRGPVDGLTHEAVWTARATLDRASGAWVVQAPVRRTRAADLSVPAAAGTDGRGHGYVAALRPVT